jgi:hypothetical protein
MTLRAVVAPWLFFVALTAAGQTSIGEMGAPSDRLVQVREPRIPSAVEPAGPGTVIIRSLFWVYQRRMGPTKGVRCPMFPSCSEYGRQCVARHGLVVGVLMTADRLHRCGHDLRHYERSWSVSGGWFHEDAPR